MFDPLPRFRPARPAQVSVPRISTPDFTRPVFIAERPSPSPDDSLSAERLALRMAALGRVLDDLPRHARRFARWRCRVAAGAQREVSRLDHDRRGGFPFQPRGGIRSRARTRRIWPLRPGRPPGVRRAGDEVRRVLENTHGLAVMALNERPDTS
jgi:hypothetical protein